MVVLDGSKFLDREKSFEYINSVLDLSYQVTNLDALNDALSMLDEEISIVSYREIYNNMGSYGKTMIEVFLRSSLNRNIRLNLLVDGGCYA